MAGVSNDWDWDFNEDDEMLDEGDEVPSEDCPDCDGSGYTSCPEMCGGDPECEVCDGGDEVECPECDG